MPLLRRRGFSFLRSLLEVHSEPMASALPVICLVFKCFPTKAHSVKGLVLRIGDGECCRRGLQGHWECKLEGGTSQHHRSVSVSVLPMSTMCSCPMYCYRSKVTEPTNLLPKPFTYFLAIHDRCPIKTTKYLFNLLSQFLTAGPSLHHLHPKHTHTPFFLSYLLIDKTHSAL